MKKNIRSLLVATLGIASLVAVTGCVKAKEYKAGSPVKVGLICLHDNQSTYDKNFIDALGEAKKDLGDRIDGDPIIKTGIPEDQECFNAAKDLVKQGCNVIFADSFGHEEFMLKAAQKWPQVQFCHATGTQALTAKVSNYHNAFASIYEGRYLAGYAAGLKLARMVAANEVPASSIDSNGKIKLGYIGAFQYAEVISGYTSWYLGVREVVPNVVMDVTFTKSWYDFDAEEAGARALIAGDPANGRTGAALVSQHADSMGAPGECEKSRVPDVGYNVSTAEQCPNTYVAHSRINWAPYYKAVINSMFDGKAIEGEVNNNWTGTLASGSVEYNVANEADKLVCEGIKAELANGSRKVFDCSKFTVTKGEKVNTGATVDNDGHLTAYQADVEDMGDYAPDTNVIKSEGGITFFDESANRSAPYFDLTIDGITLLNSGF